MSNTVQVCNKYNITSVPYLLGTSAKYKADTEKPGNISIYVTPVLTELARSIRLFRE